ncbi:MAG: rRNA adenine N(6)-methyltransferase family protein [Actinomycetota bacterium]
MASSRRRWGWHQLQPAWADRLVAAADLRPGALVLDIGAGHGVLTGSLLDAGMRVIAVELHPARAETLRGRFGDRVTVVRADAADLRLPTRSFHVVANPPFGVSSPLLRRLVSPGSRLRSAHIIVPTAVAARWAGASAPAARRWQPRWHPQVAMRIPRSAFSPRPRVDSAVLRLQRRGVR